MYKGSRWCFCVPTLGVVACAGDRAVPCRASLSLGVDAAISNSRRPPLEVGHLCDDPTAPGCLEGGGRTTERPPRRLPSNKSVFRVVLSRLCGLLPSGHGTLWHACSAFFGPGFFRSTLALPPVQGAVRTICVGHNVINVALRKCLIVGKPSSSFNVSS